MKHIEDNLQIACVRWFSLQYPRLSNYLHHSPNGGFRNLREAGRFKQMGVRAGFPDLILLYPSGKYHYLCIELKSEKGKQTESQKKWHKMIQETGNKYVVCRNLDQFMTEINNYMNLNQNMK